MHMKKIIALALSAALLLSMAACAGPEAQSTEPEVITAEVRAKLDAIAQEKNYRGIELYRRHGFLPNGEKELEEGTAEYLLKLVRG